MGNTRIGLHDNLSGLPYPSAGVSCWRSGGSWGGPYTKGVPDLLSVMASSWQGVSAWGTVSKVATRTGLCSLLEGMTSDQAGVDYLTKLRSRRGKWGTDLSGCLEGMVCGRVVGVTCKSGENSKSYGWLAYQNFVEGIAYSWAAGVCQRKENVCPTYFYCSENQILFTCWKTFLYSSKITYV